MIARPLASVPSLLLVAGALATLVPWGCGSSDTENATCPDGTGPKLHEAETLEVNTVWTADCGPHVVTHYVRVGEGVTLTITPGARVELAKDAVFEVGTEAFATPAHLVASGTADRPILFTRNGDAPFTAITVQYPSKATFEHVVIEGGGADAPNTSNASLIVRGDYQLPRKDMVTLAHVTIRDSVGPGLWVRESASLTAESTDLTVTGSGKAGTTDMTHFPVSVSPTALTNFPVGKYTGNAVDELLVDTEDTSQGVPDVLEDVTVHDRGVPYRVGSYAGSSLRFGTDETHAKVTLTIEAGVTLRFPRGDEAASGGAIVLTNETDSASTNLPGTTIVAKGTAEKPIVFTSAADKPAPGDWQGLWFGLGANADNVLDHVVIEYAGSDLLAGGFACPLDHSNNGAIAIMGGRAEKSFLTNSIVRHSAAAGVVRGWALTEGPAVDFKPTNTFVNIAECEQTIMLLDQGDCPDGSCG